MDEEQLQTSLEGVESVSPFQVVGVNLHARTTIVLYR